jgi:NADP-dependent alcohol dehydrogenase
MLNFELCTSYQNFEKRKTEKLSKLVPTNAKVLLAYGGGSIFKNGVHEVDFSIKRF